LCDDGRQGDGSPVGLGRSPTLWHIQVLNWCPGFTALIEPLVCDAGEAEGVSSNNRTDQGVVLTHNWPTRGVNRDGGNYRDYSKVEMKCNHNFYSA